MHTSLALNSWVYHPISTGFREMQSLIGFMRRLFRLRYLQRYIRVRNGLRRYLGAFYFNQALPRHQEDSQSIAVTSCFEILNYSRLDLKIRSHAKDGQKADQKGSK